MRLRRKLSAPIRWLLTITTILTGGFLTVHFSPDFWVMLGWIVFGCVILCLALAACRREQLWCAQTVSPTEKSVGSDLLRPVRSALA